MRFTRLDVLQEVGNIGTAHAATALGQLLDRTVMIGVPVVNESAAGEVAGLGGQVDALVAGVSFHMLGDASGRMVMLLPRASAIALVDVLLRNAPGTTKVLNDLGHSTLKETGNIMASTYMNGLSEFLGLLLLPSVPNLVFDLSGAVLEQAAEGVEKRDGRVLSIATSFSAEGTDVNGRLFCFLDASSEEVLASAAAAL